ncbi:MAG: hypothetical protein ACR2NO_11640 [Chloroflexota bacterium]
MRVLACAAAALLGAGLISSELAFTRLFGYLYTSGRVFTLAGLGALGVAAGAFLAHRIGWHPRRRPTLLAASAALTGTVSLLTAIAAASGATTLLARLPLGLPEFVLAYLAFAVLGVGLGALAALDPAGAGWSAAALFAGCAVAAVVFPMVGGVVQPATVALIGSALIALVALPASLSSLGAGATRPVRDEVDEGGGFARVVGGLGIGLLALVPIAGLAAQVAMGWLSADPAQILAPKPLFQSVSGEADSERVVFSSWDAHSRIDVTEHPRNPAYRWIYQDGLFTGRMYRLSGSAFPTDLLRQDIAYLPYFLPGGKDRVLVIGVGGGQEVAAALSAGAREVVAADSSPGLRAAARDLEEFNGGLFDRSGVRYVEEDGRTFLRSDGGQYDLIFLTFGATGAAQPGGATASAGLLTMEAYATYMNALKPDGRLVVQLRDQEEILRAFSTAYQAGLRLGGGQLEAARRIVVFNNQPLAEANAERRAQIVLPLMTVRKTPYQQQEIAELARALEQTPYLPVFLPHAEQASAQVYPWLVGIVQAGPEVIEANVPVDIRPATDARPFFYDSLGALPIVPLGALLVLAGVSGAAAWVCRRPEGEGLEIADEADAAAAAFLEQHVPWRYLGFGALAGAAWGFLSLPLLHRIPHLIGQPLFTAPVVYGALFGGASLGALVAGPVRMDSLRPVIGWAGLAGGILSVAVLELLPLIAGTLGALGLGSRVAAVVLLLAQIGFCLGVPLPAAVRLLAGARRAGWVTLVMAVALLAATAARFLAYVAGNAWTLSIPTVLGGCCLFGVFLMAGLRALVFSSDELEADTPSTFKTGSVEDHTAWKKPTL